MDKPQPWSPYSRDCSQGYCSYYCPQWCFFLFPPPPPPSPSRPLLSPLLIAVIAVVSTAFLLVAYYLILTHYRRHRRTRASGPASPPDNRLAAWHGARTDGLDETLINRIAACQYRAGGGLIVDGTDCSVCLSQFEDGDCIRLLPKCGHAFHVDCIDTWLKAHSSCPLCRAGIFPLPANNSIGSTNNGTTVSSAVTMDQRSESELSAGESEMSDTTIENPNARGTTDVVSHDIIEIRECGPGVIGRSLSMDSSLRRQSDGAGPSRWGRTLQSVLTSPIQMKRSRSLTSTLPT